MITTPLEEIEAMALQLPASDRSHLAESLLASLSEEDEILAAWIEEAERRADAYDRGEVETVDFDESIARARARIASRHTA